MLLWLPEAAGVLGKRTCHVHAGQMPISCFPHMSCGEGALISPAQIFMAIVMRHQIQAIHYEYVYEYVCSLSHHGGDVVHCPPSGTLDHASGNALSAATRASDRKPRMAVHAPQPGSSAGNRRNEDGETPMKRRKARLKEASEV